MSIKQRKLRKVGNSVVMTLSKDFLEINGLDATDTVYIDETKLKEAIVKKERKSAQEEQLEMMIAKSVQKHDALYKELVTK